MFHSRRKNAAVEKEQVLSEKVANKECYTSILLAIPSAGSMLLTYYGVSVPLMESGATLIQKGQALAFAATVGLYSWITWNYLFGLVYRLSGRQLRTALLAGGIMVSLMAGIDAPFNMLALSGSRASQMSLVDVAKAYEGRGAATVERTTIASRLAPALRAQARRFRELEQNEIAYGSSSGRSGHGKVSAAYGQIATLLEALIEDLQAGVADMGALQEPLTRALRAMKAATYREGPIRERMAEVSYAADSADEAFAAFRERDFVQALDSTLASLEASLADSSSGSTGYQKTQSDEVNAIAARIAPVTATLRNALDELGDQRDITGALPRPEDPMTAIFTYWQPLMTNWTAALFIGVAPAGLLIILVAAFREVEVTQEHRRDRRKPAKSKDHSVKES